MKTHKQRILLSAGAIQGGRSGVGRYVIELARNLRTSDSTIELYVAGLKSDQKHFPDVNELRWVNIPPLFKSGIGNLLWHQCILPLFLLALKIDILHIPTYRRILALCPCTQIATIHDCAPFLLKNKYGYLRQILGTKFVPLLARRCDKIIAVSETTAYNLREFMKIPKDKIVTILNGFDHSVFYKRESTELDIFRKNKKLDAPYFIYIARLEHPGKNHIELIKGFNHFKERSDSNHRLYLGGADWQGSDTIREFAKQSKYSDSIHFTGFVLNEDLPLWYGASEALVFPSLIEGFGLPIIEALSCGTLVASSPRGSLKEVGGNATHYFEPDSPEDIANTLQWVASISPEARTPMIQNGIRWSRQYSWKKCATACLDLYSHIQDSAKSQTPTRHQAVT